MIDDAILPLLPSLLALVDEQNVTRAARRLGISQPRMSARLAELRRLLGDPLLVSASRTRGLLPTARAIELADAARRSLNDLAGAFAADAFDPAAAQRTFRIMANDNASVIVGVPLANAIRSAAGPDVRLAFYAYDEARLAGLEDGTLDLALGSRAQFEAMPSLMARACVRDGFVTAGRADALPAPLDLDSFCARDHVIVSGSGGGFEGVVDRALATLGRSRRVVASVQNYLVAVELAASSDLLATLPRALLQRRQPDLALAETPLDLDPFLLSAAWHPRVSSDPAHRWLRETLFALDL